MNELSVVLISVYVKSEKLEGNVQKEFMIVSAKVLR